MERERESGERENIVAVAIIFTASFHRRYQQQAGCAGPSGPWEPETLIYTSREQASSANIHAGNEAVDGGNMAAPVWSVSMSHVSVTTVAVAIIFTTSFVNGKNLAAPVWSVSVSHLSVTP